jgi:hypothetical protein
MKPKTTLTQEEEKIIRRQYGKGAKPALFDDKSIEGLIRANCSKKESAWKVFAKNILV